MRLPHAHYVIDEAIREATPDGDQIDVIEAQANRQTGKQACPFSGTRAAKQSWANGDPGGVAADGFRGGCHIDAALERRAPAGTRGAAALKSTI